MSAPGHRRPAKAGTVAIEFGLIGMSFVGMLMLVFQLGFLLYAQTALDYAVKQTARQLLTGQQSIASGTAQAAFQSSLFCHYLAGFLPCGNIVVTLQPVQNFQAPPLTAQQLQQNPTPTVNPGTSGSLVLMQAYYTPGILNWPLNVQFLVGTAAYRNEF